ncbi:nuclear transport factor 2 family protein [Solihabitans fulvus]|uniref:nuclear transport factor 2 family protein n=1 Tax=Solihabitans fulvus TaxID=1892852 RepID=UPI001661F147|nr:nuclear transport factor 2 family protein [Solihabitans fulvus]
MSGAETIVQKYLPTWREPDPEVRAKAIAELWSTDAIYRNATTEYVGRLGIEHAVTEAYETFAVHGCTFRVDSVDTNHEAIRYRWEMLPPGGGEPTAIGTQVVVLDADGLMVRDHQFLDKAPTT